MLRWSRVSCVTVRARFEAVNSETEPPRVVVFAQSANEAVQLAQRLQGALFGTISGDASTGLWGLSVLLPSAEALLVAADTNGDGVVSKAHTRAYKERQQRF